MRILLALLLLLSGCALAPTLQDQSLLRGKVLLVSDTLWQGEIVVDGEVTVAKGVTLTIAPGTHIRFVRRDADRDGLGDATLIVKGSLVASGTQSAPIRFLSAEADPRPADWLEIRSDFARQLLFDWCELRDSAYGIHAHFTRGHMRNSHIHNNIDGCRLGRSRFLFQNNLVENNRGKGINFRDSEVSLLDNIIRDNRAGIFLFEKPGKSVISGNNIYQNEINLQLGDFFADSIALGGNWWGDTDPQRIALNIHDRQDDPELGSVATSPVSGWLFKAGIQRNLEFEPLWEVATNGFVDTAPVEVNGKIFVASWDGHLRALSPTGQILWQVDTGDIIDGGLQVSAGQIFLQNWSRQLFQVDQQDGQLRRIYEYPASPADDHRQAGVAIADKLLLLPAWNGSLYAFDMDSKDLRWSFDAGMPLRATPLVAGERIYQASGSNRLSALDNKGELLWQQLLAAPLLSSPVQLGENVAILDKAGTLTAFSPAGVLLWENHLAQSSFYATPLVVGDAIFVATAAGAVWKINASSGQTVWSRPLGGSIYAPPVASDAGLLVGDNAGSLYLLDFDSGRTLATYNVAGAIQSQVWVTGNRLFFGSRDQKLHALQLVRKEVP